MYNLNELKAKYQNSIHKDDRRLLDLDSGDFIGFLWQLNTGRFDCTGFSTKGFLRFVLSGNDATIKFINEIDVNDIERAKNFLIN